jgi:hypothetical protein
MGIDACQLRQLVINPALHCLERYSVSAEALLLGIAAAQSDLGNVLADNHRYGLFQISAESHQRCWDTYLAKDPCLASQVRGLASQHAFLNDPHAELVVNLRYATAIAWLMIEARHVELPTTPDIQLFAQIWQQVFKPEGRLGDFSLAWQRCLAEYQLAA